MSKTSIKERNKAIRLAWEREQELVSEGKGTRDWSQEQQKDILNPEKGKAYDENGRAFEGQHMKSAAEYPEYQGDPNNIQFLTREEHLEAHKGSWQNPTNWYYNPETKEFVDFGENKPIPCEVINLTEPVRTPVIDKQEGNDGIKEPSKTEEASSGQTQSSKQDGGLHNVEHRSQKKIAVAPPEVHESFGDKILHAVDAVREFSEKHPVLTGVELLLRQSQRLLSQVIVQVEGDHLKIATLIIHLQIHMMIIATMLMMSMTMITVIHMTQENIPMNARRHENMMYRDTIVNRTVRLYM